ncbi:ethanolamine ammonia-lyase subunit EutC [Chitinophaga barathri]|uniref:Ethanolamine ammonia-lyase small subunit n=1 Tax=Chitinophaga barathri TaxID=1647451 RepID=A0A3N4MJR0_9BACT|nr:ethanolamine ammonia-lyase subunit EutC [Chitinophaga barathri]RPD42117.1 ethanolamine ammonia-lyase subunit EutC [Chitinophaga barathri]
MSEELYITPDPWSGLRRFTAARIALGRTGAAIPLREVLQFRLAHAHARDAVFSALDLRLFTQQPWEINILHSEAADRTDYLQRPDKGRKLHPASAASFAPANKDVAIIVVDGLSATAANQHAIPLIERLMPMLLSRKISCAPIQLVQQGRVAIGDEIGGLLQAKLSILLIGERPGLSSPDSLGVYLTFSPRPGITDEARNCISNIRPEGLPYDMAAAKIFYLVQEALRLQLTGIMLKDNYTPALP